MTNLDRIQPTKSLHCSENITANDEPVDRAISCQLKLLSTYYLGFLFVFSVLFSLF